MKLLSALITIFTFTAVNGCNREYMNNIDWAGIKLEVDKEAALDKSPRPASGSNAAGGSSAGETTGTSSGTSTGTSNGGGCNPHHDENCSEVEITPDVDR